MSPAQINKRKKYYLLDQSKGLAVVLHGTAEELRVALHDAVNAKTIEKAIDREKVFSYGNAHNCIIVEDFDYNDTIKKAEPKRQKQQSKINRIEAEDCEQWRTFKIDAHFMWYVSNRGRVKKKQISNGEETPLVTKISRKGEMLAIVGRKREKVKDLVARTFMRDEYKKYAEPLVKVLDGNPNNCAVGNLRITESA